MRCHRLLLVGVVLVGCGDNSSSDGVLTRDEIMRACISDTACIEPSYDLIGCLTRITFKVSPVSVYRPEQVRCLAAAGPNCSQAGDCVGVTSGSGCPTFGATCDGSRLVFCFQGGAQSTIECAGGLSHALDETCVVPEPPFSEPDCGVAACEQSEMHCNGTRLEWCNNGVLLVEECATTGDTCIEDITGPRCGTSLDEKCSGGMCSGDALLICDQFAYQHRVECPALIAGSTCTPELGCGFTYQCNGIEAHCEGDVLSGCVLGVPTQFDCKMSGYAGCFEGRCIVN